MRPRSYTITPKEREIDKSKCSGLEAIVSLLTIDDFTHSFFILWVCFALCFSPPEFLFNWATLKNKFWNWSVQCATAFQGFISCAFPHSCYPHVLINTIKVSILFVHSFTNLHLGIQSGLMWLWGHLYQDFICTAFYWCKTHKMIFDMISQSQQEMIAFF